MKRVIFALLLFGVFNLTLAAGSYDAQWKLFHESVQRGLPRTAITNLEPILTAALADRDYPEAVKAIGWKIALEGNIQGNKPEEKIRLMQTEIARAPAELKPMLETLLANWYWHYFQQNRWRFLNRTATAEPPGDDFTTWDLPRIFAEIDKRFQAALAADGFLKATPVADWDALLVKGTMPDRYRPTLYDFVAQEALEFYTSGEQAGAQPQDAFELRADSPALGDVAEFLNWQPGADNSPTLKAIALYQALLRFHEADADRGAFIDANLARLVFAGNVAIGDDKTARYQVALKSFVERWANHELSSLAAYHWASSVKGEGDLVEARAIALRAAQAHPDSPGARLCLNLVAEIESKSARISTEGVWNAPWPDISIRYRNVDAVYFRAIPVNWERFLDRRRNRPENLNDTERREILARPPALEWVVQLPPTTDYKERGFATNAPSRLSPGFYFVAASHDPQFGESNNVVSLTQVWVSNLALVTRTRDGNIEGFVLEANSGEPIAGAAVDNWNLDRNGNRIAGPTLNTDSNGFFSLKPAENRGYLFRARHSGRELATSDDLWAYDWNRRNRQRPETSTIFFTDRGIYRPGQTIQYKGLCIWVDQTRNNYEVLKGEDVTVVFKDVTGKEISRQKQRANDYGSFAGSFTAPRDRLMGQMSLLAEGRARGVTYFSVEEYKRPKFEVTLDAPIESPKLNETVRVKGHATSYTGAAVDGALVKYRVVRQVRWPWWWRGHLGWGGGWRSSPSQEIVHGTARTATDGSFQIEFVAKPDVSISPTNEPTFEFQVTVDVTDSAGETRSADRTIRIGYTALEAVMTADEWQTDTRPVELRIQTKTLDGEPQSAVGRVKIQALVAPERVVRAPLVGSGYDEDGEPDNDLSNPDNWPVGQTLFDQAFTTDTNGVATVSFKLDWGVYRAELETQDRFGKRVTGRLLVRVLAPEATRLGIKVPQVFAGPQWQVEPGTNFLAVWGTGYEAGRAFIEIEHRGQIIRRYWTAPGRTQQQIEVAVTEAMRGGFIVHVTQVRENRAYLVSRKVSVPWSNKELDIRWEHFVSKLQPGQKETWTAAIQIKNSKSEIRDVEKAIAEMVATLYDESLDAFAPLNWPRRLSVFYEDASQMQSQFANRELLFQHVWGTWNERRESVAITYRSFPPELTENLWGYGYFRSRRMSTFGGAPEPAMMAPAAAALEDGAAKEVASITPLPARGGANVRGETEVSAQLSGEADGTGGASKPDLSQVSARRNLNETAFFYPQLTSDSNGVVRITFTMPEALTRWRFMAFAHDKVLRNGFLEDHAVTAKDLMVQPNPPRFLREGDTVVFTVKVSNQSNQPQRGQVRLTFAEAATEQSADQMLGNGTTEQSFDIPARESRSFSWRITVPDGSGFLTYKAVAATDKLSDGEEGVLPVLSRRVLVTESLPLPIRGPATKRFEFTKLLKSGDSKTLSNQSLVVQMVSNPAWYAVLALPYLMEYPYECSEQVFNRLYANALARHIANSDPKVRRIFDQWKNTPALDSPLEKSQDLKSVMLEETPWLRQAASESQARRNVGILFDQNRLDYEAERNLQKLAEMQLADGRWPWFPSGPGNEFITLYITAGFGRLRHLGVEVDVNPALRSLRRLDEWMSERHANILKNWSKPDDYVPTATDALYLYGRSFFLKDLPLADEHKAAAELFLQQARRHWLKTENRMTQGHLALALNRWGGDDNRAVARAIVASIKERSVTNEELGMFWRDTELSWWWYRAPIETQALMIEAFDEVTADQASVEECRVWLLKQKQTQEWKTTKATSDAVYVLLLRGTDLLSSDSLVEVKLDGVDVTPTRGEIRDPKSEVRSQPEPGTGFYEYRFAPADIKPALGEITVKKVDAGVAWGSVTWQYLEDMSKVTPYEGTPLKIKKTLFTKVNTASGPVLQPVSGPLAVGDELVVRIELRVDRDMEFIHLKDQRGSGTEPVNVLSGYRYQDGLGYYESTRDTASHFFMDYLPKGTYVFEYSTRVQLRGRYQSGIAEIQCLYAPEFNSHSESMPLEVN